VRAPLRLVQETNASFDAWLKASRDPRVSTDDRFRAFADFSQRSALLAQYTTKARSDEREELNARLERALDEELAALPRFGRKLTEREVEDFVQRLALRVGAEVTQEFRRAAKNAYVAGLEEVTRRTGVRLQFNGFHEGALRAVIEGDGAARTYADFTEGMARRFNGVVRESYEAGEVSPGKITTRLIDEAGWQARKRLERIARTETWKIWMEAQVHGYEDAEERAGEVWRYRFGKINDAKTCDICGAIMAAIPSEGLPLQDLLDTMERIIRARAHPGWNPTRDGKVPLPHPNCRHDIWRTVRVPAEAP
jgi:hypothetical protein